jgi:hypothetical protein
MTYNKFYKILSFEKTKSINTKLLSPQKDLIVIDSKAVQSPKIYIYIYKTRMGAD